MAKAYMGKLDNKSPAQLIGFGSSDNGLSISISQPKYFEPLGIFSAKPSKASNTFQNKQKMDSE